MTKENKCSVCGCLLASGLSWYKSYENNSKFICITCTKKKSNDWRIKNRERFNSNQRNYNKRNKGYQNEYQRRYTFALKIDVMSHYSKKDGIKCACCGESSIQFLTIDHINGDGAKHRKECDLKNTKQFYKWLQKNNYPNGFRILCFNCNISRGFFGYCPHEGMIIKRNS